MSEKTWPPIELTRGDLRENGVPIPDADDDFLTETYVPQHQVPAPQPGERAGLSEDDRKRLREIADELDPIVRLPGRVPFKSEVDAADFLRALADHQSSEEEEKALGHKLWIGNIKAAIKTFEEREDDCTVGTLRETLARALSEQPSDTRCQCTHLVDSGELGKYTCDDCGRSWTLKEWAIRQRPDHDLESRSDADHHAADQHPRPGRPDGAGQPGSADPDLHGSDDRAGGPLPEPGAGAGLDTPVDRSQPDPLAPSDTPECERCGGTGERPGVGYSRWTCPDCLGSGKKPAPTEPLIAPSKAQRKEAEAAGIAAGRCPYCEGEMDAFGGIHTKTCPIVGPPVSEPIDTKGRQ